MSHDLLDAWVLLVKTKYQLLHRLLLLRSASIGDATVLVESSLIADANGMGVVASGVSTHPLYRATSVNHTVEGDVEVIPDVTPTIYCHMVVAKLFQGVTAIAASSTAMHHDHIKKERGSHSKNVVESYREVEFANYLGP